MSPVAPRRYAAFLSYRHADNREAGRRWADWLHQQLETYAVPRDLVGKPNLRGEPIPASLYPVFRDEEELPADADLTVNLRRALEGSATLIVLCSPRACASRFVADEIRTFKELGRSDRILAFMLDGEPNADDPAKASQGIRAEQENLPEPLRFGVPGPDGRVDWSRRTEPIAADARPGGRPEQGCTSAGAYADTLKRAGGLGGRTIHALEREYAERLELARLKLVAGVLGVPLGQLRARDAVYRARRLRRLALVFGSLALLALVAALVAVWQGQRAERNFKAAEAARTVQRAQLLEASRSTHAAAERELRAGHWREGVCLLGRALTYDPANETAAAHLWSALAYGEGDRDEPPLASWRFDDGVAALAASPDGRWLAVASTTGGLVVAEFASGRRWQAQLPAGAPARRLRFHPSRPQLLIAADILRLLVAAWNDAGATLQVTALAENLHDGAFSADGTLLWTVGATEGLQRLDARTLRPAPDPKRAPEAPPAAGPGLALGAALSPEATAALLESRTGSLRQLDLVRGTERALTGDVAATTILRAELSAHATYLAQLGSGRLGIWALDSATQVVKPEPGVGLWPGFAFRGDGGACVVDTRDGTLQMIDLVRRLPHHPRVRHPGFGVHCAFSGDGTQVLTGDGDGVVAAWASPRAHAAGPRQIPEAAILRAAWLTPERAALLRTDAVSLWDVEAGAPRLAATLATGPAPGGLAAGPNGAWLAVGGPQGQISLWDASTLARKGVIEGPRFEAYQLAAARHAERLVVCAFDLGRGKLEQVLQVYDATSGAALGPEVRLERLVLAYGLSADGQRLLCLPTIGVPWRGWNVSGVAAATTASSAELATIAAEDIREVEHREARRGGALLATSSAAHADTSRSVLDLATRLPRSEPLGAPNSRSIWSPDGRRLLCLEEDGTVRLYDTPTPAPPGPWLEDLVAAASGLALGEGGLGQPLAVADRAAARARLLAAHAGDPDWQRLLHWWLTPLGERLPGP